MSHLPGHKGSLPAALGKGFCPLPAIVGQTENLVLLKAQPSWSLEAALSLGSSLELSVSLGWRGSLALELWLMRMRVKRRWLWLFFSPGEAAMPWLCRAGRGAGLRLWGLCSQMGLAAGLGSLTCLCMLGLEEAAGSSTSS